MFEQGYLEIVKLRCNFYYVNALGENVELDNTRFEFDFNTNTLGTRQHLTAINSEVTMSHTHTREPWWVRFMGRKESPWPASHFCISNSLIL